MLHIHPLIEGMSPFLEPLLIPRTLSPLFGLSSSAWGQGTHQHQQKIKCRVPHHASPKFRKNVHSNRSAFGDAQDRLSGGPGPLGTRDRPSRGHRNGPLHHRHPRRPNGASGNHVDRGPLVTPKSLRPRLVGGRNAAAWICRHLDTAFRCRNGANGAGVGLSRSGLPLLSLQGRRRRHPNVAKLAQTIRPALGTREDLGEN